MTKLKNTKKGMAKKALSVSLVAAMLATSNVPVWAAEDLFSDGSASVETPIVAEPTADTTLFSAGETDAAPVEEAPSDTPALNKVDDEDAVITLNGLSDGRVDISNESGINAVSTNVSVAAGEDIHVNWYATSDQITVESGEAYVSGKYGSEISVNELTDDGKYINANYENGNNSQDLKSFLGKYLTAVVYQNIGGPNNPNWVAVAASDSVPIVSSNVTDYVQKWDNMRIDGGNVEADDLVNIKGVSKVNTGVEANIVYQWYRDGSPIEGANSSAYTITQDDVGHKVYPVITVTAAGFEETKNLVDSAFSVWGTTETTFEWTVDNKKVVEGVACDAGVLNLKVTLPFAISDTEEAAIKIVREKGGDISVLEEETVSNGSSFNIAHTLTNGDANSNIYAEITVNGKEFKSKSIKVTEPYIVLDGEAYITVKDGTDARPGVTLEAHVDKIELPPHTNFNELSYQWLYRDSTTDGKWIPLSGETKSTYEVQTEDYGREICVAVYGGEVYQQEKSILSDYVTIKAAVEVKGKFDISIDTELDTDNDGKKDEAYFNPTDLSKNRLESKIKVTYTVTVEDEDREEELIAGEDYNLKFIGADQVGTVTVIATILPSEKTDYYSGTVTHKDLYELVIDKDTVNGNFKISGDTVSEYNGKTIQPNVTVKQGNTILSSDRYTVYAVGPNAADYEVYAYVEGAGIASGNATHTINPKNISKHESDFRIVIPDAVWNAEDARDVIANDVSGGKIQVFDTAISETNDILESEAGKTNDEENYTIEALNWGEGGVKKSIRITFKHGNYKGSLTVYGAENSRSIEQFAADFTQEIKDAADYTYNGLLQDALGDVLAYNGSISFKDGTTLYEGRDFEYQIVKGGTDAGEVSYYIEGKGSYNGSMTLSNVYEIKKAIFNDNNQVKDNITLYEDKEETKPYFNISYDPSLGDAGADISAYTDAAKNLLALTMKESNYKLTLGKDYWLDKVNEANNNRVLWYQPTVTENKVEGHGENGNFITNDGTAKRNPIKVNLVDKNLNASDIQVTIESAEYNGGNLVTPKVKVAYVKDGKEYIINPAYYDVKIVTSAYNQGETGTINIVAKQDNTNNWDSQKYPQLYTGNQMVDYTVGTTNLALGKIVATNGLETLPSVAYDAAQAATETGITLDASKYVVKDSSGNIVDPKYYTVSFSDNKAVGTATITVTGKAPYEGSTSATFTITQNNLPSGTLTLMSNDLSKVYTGEEVELVKGTDYNITGELANLTEGTDYMIVYEDNINVTDATNKAAIKVVGINNYAGEVVQYFDITPATITAEDITLGEAVYQGGVAVRPEVTVGIPGGEATLTEGTDYTVTYLTPATDAGDEGTVQITYTANKNINTADSVKEVKYTVTAKDLKDVTIQAIPDQEATGEQLRPEITVLNGSVRMVEGRDYTVTYGTNTEVGTGTVTITPVDGNANYTGTQEASFNIIEAVPAVGQAVISNIRVSGNTVTPILSGDVDGAVGYDYVLSTSADVTDTASRVDISKNILDTNTSFYYVETGTYYVYCHAWMRDENGLKVFGDWSNAIEVQVNAVTPERPMIQSAKLKGRNLTVTWSRSADATGYDIVMGKAARKVNGEMRPVDYGKAVKKITNGDTVTVTFKSIPKGTYYVGLHAWNRSSESKTKVFSPWSNGRKIVVK